MVSKYNQATLLGMLACVIREWSGGLYASSRKVLVNGAADFLSVVLAERLVRSDDGWKIRRSIHQFVS